ncbi:hypothetical protein BD410DRAFT_779477 [Rickenella mellea]|uniref:Translation initiation factor 3 N-terminal domain-containing protein n=1 Tax=Rickenella mellea TaxID=50990 RepID=A0A4V6PN23_9AGAM|nr:hypothetical protein BD410DRAFT_779477 [Rickenella mellea]
MSAVCLRRAGASILRREPPFASTSCWIANTRLMSKYSQPTHPKNEKIPYNYVSIVDNETGRIKPGPPVSLVELLRSVDLKTTIVQLVTSKPAPLVKLLDKKALAIAKKDYKERQKARPRPVEQKEIQMTWGVGVSDMEHKLKKAREELARGNRVDVVIAPKAKQPRPDVAEMNKRIQAVVDAMEDAAVEWKPRTLERGVAIIRFQQLKTSAAPIAKHDKPLDESSDSSEAVPEPSSPNLRRAAAI